MGVTRLDQIPRGLELTNTQLLMILGVGVLGAWFVMRAGHKVLNKINPLDSENVFYSGTNKVGGALTGQKDFSLGSWIYDKTHPNEAEKLGL